jgi:hypothetical protein
MDFFLPPRRWSAIIRRHVTTSRLLPALGLICYALFLARFMGACAGGADQSGYLNHARLLAEGRTSAPMRLLPELPPDGVPLFTYVPLGFNPNPDHLTMNPIYPPGLPLLIMAAASFTGWDAAPGLVMGIHALAGLWLIYGLGRSVGLEAGWAWLGALLLAASPLYVHSSLQTMSDLPAMVWVTAAILCAWKSRQRPWLALAAGMAFSVGVLVRPTDLLAILPVAIALGPSLRRWSMLIAGGLPGAFFQGAFNLAAYGHLTATGYGGLGGLLGWEYVPVTLIHYALWLPVLLTPLVFLSFGLPVLQRRSFPPACLAAWALAFPSFYLFYSYTHGDWWWLRFLLPAFPPLTVAALLVGRAWFIRLGISSRAWWLAPAALAVLVHGAVWSRSLHAFSIGRNERVYPQMAAWLQDHLPANAVVAAMQTSGALFYYTNFTVIRWNSIPPADFQRIAAACTAAKRPVYAALFPFEINDAQWAAFPKHLPGRWTQIGAVRQVSFWRYESPADAP